MQGPDGEDPPIQNNYYYNNVVITVTLSVMHENNTLRSLFNRTMETLFSVLNNLTLFCFFCLVLKLLSDQTLILHVQ